ncbi:hypothetical protein GOP47_0025410 [Adiantum capillus-veneris]|uniref:Peroxiredoxin-like 2A n=1 Tax=Adiantum capillus-veneris TaxID=13818 RepID=A0A9D4U081_ADICA|nr:hypothetical protein GOP47_0025410 [Adiantum capillus-veneris]
MASFSLEEFVGNGVLKQLLPSLVEEGWDDVPTLKMMSAEDMDAHNLSQQQRDVLEIRTYLHDRSLMEYADKLEASGKGLPELLNLSPATLSTQYGMRRGHVARFIDRAMACGIVMPPSLTPVPTSRRRSSRSSFTLSKGYYDGDSLKSSPARSFSGAGSAKSFNSVSDVGREKSMVSVGSFKGIVAAAPPEPRFCGFIGPSPVAQDVAPLSVLDKISLQKITPEYRPGADPWSQGELKLPPPMKASDIWALKPSIIFCIRRPGCVMCRAEAHQLYSRKPIFDALGVQLVAIVNELIEAEVKSFWPRFWGGMILVDKNRDFFRALGGGTLPKESFLTGFLLNPVARSNYQRAKATGIEFNYNGEGSIKGGLLILRPGKGGVAYQFVERNFGDWAPLEELLEVCGRLLQESRPETIKEESVDYFRAK